MSKLKRQAIAVFSVIVFVAAILAMRFSSHSGAWLIGLIASVPLFAAILGGLPDPKK